MVNLKKLLSKMKFINITFILLFLILIHLVLINLDPSYIITLAITTILIHCPLIVLLI